MKTRIVQRTITWGDLDPLGIVFYPRFSEWIDASSHLFFDSLGLNIVRIWRERNIQFGLVETTCRYHYPGRYQDLVEIETGIDELRSKTVILEHLIRRREDRTLLVRTLETRVCLDVSDPQTFEAITIPEDIRMTLKQAV
jgi:4-hydroxybenzoyl-CoA thioesterase